MEHELVDKVYAYNLSDSKPVWPKVCKIEERHEDSIIKLLWNFIRIGLGLKSESKEEKKYEPITQVYAYGHDLLNSAPIYEDAYVPSKCTQGLLIVILNFIKSGLKEIIRG